MKTCPLAKGMFHSSPCIFCTRDFCSVAMLHVIRSPSLDQQCCSMLQHAAAAKFLYCYTFLHTVGPCLCPPFAHDTLCVVSCPTTSAGCNPNHPHPGAIFGAQDGFLDTCTAGQYQRLFICFYELCVCSHIKRAIAALVLECVPFWVLCLCFRCPCLCPLVHPEQWPLANLNRSAGHCCGIAMTVVALTPGAVLVVYIYRTDDWFCLGDTRARAVLAQCDHGMCYGGRSPRRICDESNSERED